MEIWVVHAEIVKGAWVLLLKI